VPSAQHSGSHGRLPRGGSARSRAAITAFGALGAGRRPTGVRGVVPNADLADDVAGAVCAVYARFMPDPPPARSAPANVALPHGLLISIDAVAVLAPE
jgi:2-iminobutanoate/2-iminopropanoate deaminase